MVNVIVEEVSDFTRTLNKIKDNSFKSRIKKQVLKIVENPEIGKPMRYERRGTREVYVGHSRLSYAYLKEENKIILLDIYHKDEQ